MPRRSSTSLHPQLDQADARIAPTATRPQEDLEPGPGKNPAAVALGKLGGKKGGLARAKNLSASERSEIASRAAKARWSKNK